VARPEDDARRRLTPEPLVKGQEPGNLHLDLRQVCGDGVVAQRPHGVNGGVDVHRWRIGGDVCDEEQKPATPRVG